MDNNVTLEATETSTLTETTDNVNLKEETKLSEREFKMAYQRALKERKEKIKQNKEMIEDMNLEVSYWKAQADLLRYRFEKMDFYLKNIDLEPKYLQAVEQQKVQQDSQVLSEDNKILS